MRDPLLVYNRGSSIVVENYRIVSLLGKKPYAAHLSGSRVLLQLSVVVETSLESGAGLREDEDK